MKPGLLYIALLAGIFLLQVSCTPESCFEETNAFVKATFYDNSSGKEEAPDSLTVYGTGRDSILYKRASGIRIANIPLKVTEDICSLTFKINDITDTITFIYSSFPHLVSKECGYTFYHTIDRVMFTGNIIDTVMIRKQTVTTLNEENIRIFYQPDHNPE